MARLGILGTMVWDRIHARDGRTRVVEEWGGISYALAAAVAARGPGWEIVPIIKLGTDLQEAAYHFLRPLPELDLDTGVHVVSAPNNRVELRYQDQERRCERLSGGVPPWSWLELEARVASLDALYVNFISGFEMDLPTAQQLRLAFPGPIYADLHSIFLGMDAQGIRTWQPLAGWQEWLRCFDAVQMNEAELAALAEAWGDPWRFAAGVVGDAPALLLVTLGSRGAAYVAAPGFRPDPRAWHTTDPLSSERLGTPGAARSERFPPDGPTRTGDPTGCGDVWGATCFARLLAGDSLEAALLAANRAAARNVEYRGATGLHLHLGGKIPS